MEPALQCTAALHSPSTGLIDSHALMLSLLGDAERAGAVLAFNTPVQRAEIISDGFIVHTPEMKLQARQLINCAGLGAQALAQQIEGLPATHIPPLSLAKGNYFSLQGRNPFSRLIYPAPEAHGLGVHLTLDLAGQARFGPDVEWIATENYTVDARRSAVFYAAIRRYWPDLPDDALQPAYAGIRPKPHLPGESSRDFLVSGPVDHGIHGLLNLYGIESPGLTACLALAEYAGQQLLPC
jgi:L-2-hydroxyglutarate oxidase LhgO